MGGKDGCPKTCARNLSTQGLNGQAREPQHPEQIICVQACMKVPSPNLHITALWSWKPATALVLRAQISLAHFSSSLALLD